MVRKIWSLITAFTLLMALAACGAGNGDNNVAFDQVNDRTGTLNVRHDGQINDRNRTNGKEYNASGIGVDPLGRRNLNKDWNQNGSQGRQNINRTGNTQNQNGSVGRQNLNADPNISADYTQLSSNNFPHTKAIVIHDAKYSFSEVNAEQIAEIKKKIEQQLKAKFGQLTPQLRQQAEIQAQQQIQKQEATQQPQQNQKQQNTQPKQPAQQQGQAQQQPQQQQQPKQPAQQQPEQAQPKQPAQQQEQPKQPAKQPAQEQAQTGNIEQVALQVIELTNQERAKEGLPPLKADAQLSSVAKKKSQDMKANNYFSHTSPTYGSPFDMMRDHGVTYKTAGENIAQGQRTPQEVVQAWMNSEGHRKNIMSPDFTHIGVGYEAGGNHWTQMFIGK